MSLIHRIPAGRPAKVHKDVKQTARLLTAMTLRSPLGVPELIEDPANGYDRFLQMAFRGNAQWTQVAEKWDSTRELKKVFPLVERAWQELLTQYMRAWKDSVYVTGQMVDDATAKAMSQAATLEAFLKLDPTTDLYRRKLSDVFRLAITAGSYMFDWLMVGSLPPTLDAWVATGDPAREGYKLAAHGGNPLAELLGHVRLVQSHPVRDETTEIRVSSLDGSGTALAFHWRETRVAPDLKLYSLLDLLYMAVVWHAMEVTAPYIGTAQSKRQSGEAGTTVATFSTGEILVHLTDKRAILVEGTLRSLCLRYPNTVDSYMQAGSVLSLRHPDQRIIATIATYNGGTHRETKGFNNLHESQLDLHVQSLLKAIWSSRTGMDVIHAPKIRTMLDRVPSAVGGAPGPKISWLPAGDAAFAPTKVLDPAQAIHVNELRALRTDHLTIPQRLELIEELSTTPRPKRHSYYDDPFSVLSARLRGSLPFDVLALSDNRLALAHNIVAVSEGPIAVAQALEVRGLTVKQQISAARVPHAKLVQKLVVQSSLTADRGEWTSTEATQDYYIDSVLARKLFPPSTGTWRGKWYERIRMAPNSPWEVTPGAWGAPSTRERGYYLKRNYVPGGRFTLRPRALSVTQQMNKNVSFTFTPAISTLKLDKSAVEFHIEGVGTINITGARKGTATEANLKRLVDRWFAWADKQAARQLEVVQRLFVTVVKDADLAGIQRDANSAQREAGKVLTTAQTEARNAWEAEKAAAKDVRAVERLAREFEKRRGQRASSTPTEADYVSLRRTNIAAAMWL